MSAKQVVAALDKGRLPADAVIYDRQDSSVRHPVQRLKFNAARVDVDDLTLHMQAAGYANPYEFINEIARRGRRNRYYSKIDAQPNCMKMLSEGDSWHMYPVKNDDAVWHLSFMPKVAVYSTDGAGDTLQWMWEQRNDSYRGFLKSLDKVRPSHFLLNGGGNDILGARKMADGSQIGGLYFHLNQYAAGMSVDQLIKSSLGLEMDTLASLIRQIIGLALGLSSTKKVILHGYSYPFPRGDIWLGKPMARRGIASEALQRQVCIRLMDRWHERLASVAQSFSSTRRVTYVDVRASVPNKGDWFDEIHPNSDGFKVIARQIRQAM
jgi:lysophospholipase L1-like esterase